MQSSAGSGSESLRNRGAAGAVGLRAGHPPSPRSTMPDALRIDLASPAFKANPYPTYARLRREAPVVRPRIGWRREAWVVTRYVDVAALLRDPRFAKDPLAVRDGTTRGPWMPGFLRP